MSQIIPSINILMATYKPDWNYFHASMQSIQEQSFTDFELILVNDGVDPAELQDHMKIYRFPYQIISNGENLGLTRSLNKGLGYCTAKYIARFDDDDIMEPKRLQRQFEYMKSHPDRAAVFSNVKRIDADGNIVAEQTSDDNSKIRAFLLKRGNCLCHSTLFIQRDVMLELKGYDSAMLYAQDYDLYLRLLENHTIYKLPQPLVQFRQGSNRIFASKSIMSMCCTYYASMKYVHKHKSISIFASRTLRFLIGILKIVACNKIYG